MRSASIAIIVVLVTVAGAALLAQAANRFWLEQGSRVGDRQTVRVIRDGSGVCYAVYVEWSGLGRHQAVAATTLGEVPCR